MKIRKAVIPAAGLGTRFLPVSKSIPKEMIPILEKPLIQFGVDEAFSAGVDHVIIVISEEKTALQKYFSSLAMDISFTTQDRPLGLGHAILTSRPLIGDEPFVVLLPDDIICHSDNALNQMIPLFDKYGCSIIAVQDVPPQAVQNYGIIGSCPQGDGIHKITSLVEKPNPADSPSSLAIVGRYILTPQIFGCLESTRPNTQGEIQLTDGLMNLLESQDEYGYQFQGIRYDCGTPLGLLKATLEIGLRRTDTHDQIIDILRNLPAVNYDGCTWKFQRS